MPNLILFAGAPPASSLTPESCTVDAIDEAFSAFLGLSRGCSKSTPQPGPSCVTSSSPVAWRSLSLKRQPLHTGLSQTHDVRNYSLPSQPGFFTTLDVSLDQDDSAGTDVLSQFYDHALAAHNTTASLASQSESFDETTTSFGDTSFASASSDHPPPPPVPSHLSDLEDVPSARQIQALNPQTVTLNLIVGVISIASPREVTTRWGRTLSLVEVLVGDETKSGFAVTFWMTPEEVVDDDDGSGVLKLRRQDVVLLQNVALHVFRGKVYGQSLRRGMTKASVLWRRDGSGMYSGRRLSSKTAAEGSPQVRKARGVRDWVLRFVGAAPGGGVSRARTSWDRPPDDTQ